MWLNSENVSEWFDRFDTFIFDCDGVLWCGPHVIDGVNEALQILRSKVLQLQNTKTYNEGKRVVFVTNNATTSRKSYQKKMEKIGIQAASVSHILRCFD